MKIFTLTTSFCLLITTVFVSCNSYKPLGVVQCPDANKHDSLYVEMYYKYKFLEEVDRTSIDVNELKRLDSCYTFTATVAGHEGWSSNIGKKYNEYYHPEYFVLENPNEFEGKPRNDHYFSMYCPNLASEMIRMRVNNKLSSKLRKLAVSVRPYRYLYNKKTKHYQALLEIVALDTLFFTD